jgi:hypothetical protein
MFKCKRCKIEQPITEYYKTTDRKSGRKTICKTCIKADPLTKEKKLYMKNYGVGYHLKTKYNLSLEQYNALLVKQNHKCAICSIDEKEAPKGKLFVDHCHATNKVRELLCHNCNVSIGLLKESITTLSQAIAYLDKHKQGKTL